MALIRITRRTAPVALLFAVVSVARAQDIVVGGPDTADVYGHGPAFHHHPPFDGFVPGLSPMPVPMVGMPPAQMPGMMPAPLPVSPAVPLLGFMGTDIHWGVRVDSVGYGSAARQIGLEPGDVIVGLNGMPVRCMHDYRRALARSGGVVELEVRDVRSGNVVTTLPYNLFQPSPAGVACAVEQPAF